jgi:hypothetical protein
MNDQDLPDLPPDVAALLDEARGTPAAPASERRRVAGRLALSVGLAIPGASLAGARVVTHAWLGKALGVAALLVVAGGVTHRALRPTTARAPAPTAHHERAPAPGRPTAPRVEASPPPAVPAPVEPAAAALAPSPAARPAPAAAAVVVDDDRSFQDELGLVERAIAALGRDDTAGASAALSQHARRFPRGRLSPEREALRVQCAAARGDREAAEAGRRRFHQRYPDSVLGAAVDRAVDRTPSGD